MVRSVFCCEKFLTGEDLHFCSVCTNSLTCDIALLCPFHDHATVCLFRVETDEVDV